MLRFRLFSGVLMPTTIRHLLSAGVVFTFVLALARGPASATVMTNDPGGFAGIPWGASLEARPNLELAEPGGRIKGYVFKEPPTLFGEVQVESMRLFTLNGQFARVAIRYHGQRNHQLLMQHLEGRFGTIELAPGSMMRGLNQQYNWRGKDTEVNLTYRAAGEHGYLFVESRVLMPRFLDTIPEGAF